jgi:hypothetical protein
MNLSAEYDQDFHVWILNNVELLRSGKLTEVDAEHIAEELESMGKRDLRQLRSRLQVLVMHLLKSHYQPQNQTKSWLTAIDHQRDQIESLLLDSPSLREQPPQALDWIYPKAIRDASRETNLPPSTFPLQLPYSLDEILDPNFLPPHTQ